MSALFDRERIIALLAELAGRLDEAGVEAELLVVGGTAMALAYERARVTRDIDAVIAPSDVIDEHVAAMARAHSDLAPDWLNARVMPLLPREFTMGQLEALAWPGLSVNVASARVLLAMKVRAGRADRDLQDIWVLCQVLGVRSVSEVWSITDEVWGEPLVREEIRLYVGDYLRARGLRD